MKPLLGGDCNWGRCKCKNKRNTRCGNCSQEGTLYCHLHQWCSDPANAGLERDGWIAPSTPVTDARLYADFYQRQRNVPIQPAPSAAMIRASSLAAQTLQQPIERVVEAVSNISDFYVPPPILPLEEETVKPISRLGNILKEGGTCDSIIIRFFPRQLYTALQVERIYKENPALSEYSLEDVMICLKKNKKIGKGANDYLDALGLKKGGSAPAAAINNITETAARIIAQPLINLARRSIAPSAPPAPSEFPIPTAPYAPRAPSLTSTINSALTLPVPNAGKILEEIASIPSAAAEVVSEAIVTAPPPPEPVLVETAPPPEAQEGNPFSIMRSMLFLGSFFPPPQDNTVPLILDSSIINNSAKPPVIPEGFLWDYSNNKLVPDAGAFWDSRMGFG